MKKIVMMLSKHVHFAALVLMVALFSASANATPVVWQLSGFTFADGGTASGSFTYDADTNTYSAISISTTAGSVITTAKSYNVSTSSAGCNSSEVLCVINSADVNDCAGKTGATFAHTGTPLTNAGGTVALTFAREYTFENFTCSTVGAPLRLMVTGSGSFTSNPTATYSVGGNVSGLTGSVTLQNNGGDDIIKTTNDGFTFTAQAEGSDYAVTVSSQPAGQTCTVTNGSGTNITANITNVAVTCVTDEVPTYTVGGTVSGLTGSVTLQNNSGDDIIKTTNDGFTFTAQAEGSDYAVTVSSQPAGQTCTVTNGSGTNITANITNVAVTCVSDVVPPIEPVTPIPTLSQWALILFSILIGWMVFVNRRRLF